MTKRLLLIFAEGLLILITIGLIAATWMPIDAFRAWLTRIF
ncbi:MAG TPA: hypothetical protein VFE58_07220 [Tepidisphaeraceae bacterium]|jgi:hypothetical protein|nr:hypothetical protein [Tepidisphaeraceae bacterium]